MPPSSRVAFGGSDALRPEVAFTPCASFWDRDFAFGDQGASPLEPDRQGGGAGYLEPGRPFRFSLREGGALMETGKVVQERHTAPVGDRVGFFADAGHSLRLLPPEVTRGTSRC